MPSARRAGLVLDFHHRRPDRVAELLGYAGPGVRARLIRERDEEGEFPARTTQAFLLARKPADAKVSAAQR